MAAEGGKSFGQVGVKTAETHTLRVPRVQRDQWVLVQQELGHVDGVFVAGYNARGRVELRHQRKRRGGFARAGKKTRVQPIGVGHAGVVVLGVELHAVQRRQQAALGAVVAPGGAHHGVHAVFLAGAQGGYTCPAHLVLRGCGAYPRPQPARKHRFAAELAVQAQHTVVILPVLVAVIPVYQ